MINMSKTNSVKSNALIEDDQLERVVEINAIIPVISGLWRTVSHTSKTICVDSDKVDEISEIDKELSTLG